MEASSDLQFSALRLAIDRGRTAYRNRAIGCYVAAGVVLALTVALAGADFYKSGPMVLVGFLGLAGGGFHLWYRSLSWGRHRVLLAIRDAPERVTSATVVRAAGKAALLEERQVTIATNDAEIMLTVNVKAIGELGEALEAWCANITLEGFDRF